jgi:tRNA dimethylallyltransferase
LQGEAARIGNEALHLRLTEVDPESAARLHPNDVRRVVRALEVWEQTGRPLSDWQREWGWGGRGARDGKERFLVGVGHSTPDLDQRIERRARAMLDAGWVEEAVAVRADPGFGPTSIQALGYSEVLLHADGEIDRDECVARITLRTRQFARRQRTWYRKFPDIEWTEGGVAETLTALGWGGAVSDHSF